MTVDLPPGYPVEWEADVALRDGTIAHLRPIRPDDADGVRAFHAAQSDESIYLRFFAPLRELSAKDLRRFTHVDYRDRVALVCTLRDEIIGIGRYDRIAAGTAEVAFNISDRYHGKGIGSVLLEHLAAIGREQGIGEFVAEVLPQNRKMLAVFADAGFEVHRAIEDGVVQVSFDISPTEHSEAVRLAREHRAESLSMTSLLFPKSIAVVGASRREQNIGHQLLANLLHAGFTGDIHVVHPEASSVLGRPSVRSMSDIDGEVDLVIIAVPASAVLDVVDDAAAVGARALLVVSAGFAEVDEHGDALQMELLARARLAGMRVLGPNSFGVLNNDSKARLNATLATSVPPHGGLGLFAQSGALGIAVLASAARRNLGISVFASAGNRVDVSGNDFMQYWIDDDTTTAVGLHLESMGNPRKFSRIARHLAASKPVIVVKSGVSEFGIPPGHRVRRTQTPPRAFAELLRQAGVIRVSNVHQLFDVAQLVVHQPLPKSNRIAIIGNSAGLSALAAGAATARRLLVTHGPVNLPSEAGAAEFDQALTAAFAADNVDAVVCCFIPPLITPDEEVVDTVRSFAGHDEKPLVATFLGMRGVDGGTQAVDRRAEDPGGHSLPVYAMPEEALRAMAAAVDYAQWLSRDKGVPVAPLGVDREAAQTITEQVLVDAPQGRVLTEEETEAILAAYGIRLWRRAAVNDVEQALTAAQDLGYPVVLKSTSPLVKHRPGGAGIRTDLDSPSALHAAWLSLHDRLPALAAQRLVVQRMAPPGVACIVGSREDPLFGPLIRFSVAGAPTELYEDIAYRVPPLTDVEVADLVSSVKAAPLLHGHGGSAPVNRAALDDLIARVSVLADDIEELADVHLEPVLAHPGGVDVLGAEIRLAPAGKRNDAGRRSLT
ncbi:MAG: GNAT family N-acetyltransferase [Nostocoides sp.]